MAKLGVRTVDELVGRTDLLRVKDAAPGSRASKMDLDCILHNPAIANSNVHFVPADTYDFHLENTLDMKVLMKKFKLGSKNPQSVTLNVSNTDRALVPSLAARSPASTAAPCRMTCSPPTVWVPAARASARSSPKA